MTPTDTLTDPAEVARFLARYAKDHHAGAFATPTAKEIATARPGTVLDVTGPDGGRTVIVRRRLTRESRRTDFTGRVFTMPAGALLISHVARAPLTATVPTAVTRDADYVTAYAEDEGLCRALASAGRGVIASRVSAAAEVINIYGGQDGTHHTYPPYDAATVTVMPLVVPLGVRPAVTAELAGLAGWDDDFPYYSDGSWSALSLRGYWPEDPARGIKPSEMPRSWKEEHRADLARECEWTVLAERVPAVAGFVRSVPWWTNVQRVRLLQMAGRGGKGGALGRHTDITDRDSGTRNGAITRFHVPLRTHPDIVLRTWDLDGVARSTHLAAWGCYYLDARKPHAVTNPTAVDRVHLVVDVITDAGVRAMIADAHRAAPQ